MLRKVLVFVSALGCLVIAFVAGGGSVATATQGANVIAGQENSETFATVFCNLPTIGACGNSNAGLLAMTDKSVGAGVLGTSLAASGFGVKGSDVSAGGTGVFGEGYAYGVHGQGNYTGGWGVWGEGNDRGVYGVSNNEGVVGFGNNVGIRADSPNIALRVTGKVELSRSGVTLVVGTSVQPQSSVNIGDVALSAKSMVIATVQKSIAGVWVRAAVPNVAGSSVTIYLNKAVTKSVPVAWMVIEQP